MKVMEYIFNGTYCLVNCKYSGKRFHRVNIFIFTYYAKNNFSGYFTIFQMYNLVDGHMLDEGSHKNKKKLPYKRTYI